jgi:hypothetical protein
MADGLTCNAVAKTRGLRTQKPKTDTQLDPDVEAGAATSSWGEDAILHLERCYGVLG